MIFFLVLAVVIALMAVSFALQNAEPVTVRLLAWYVEGSLALVLLITLVLGILIGLLVTLPGLVRRSWTISGQRRRLTKLEEGVSGRSRSSDAERPPPRDEA